MSLRAFALAAALASTAVLAEGPWEALEPGLELGTFDGPAAPHGDRKIRVLRIDPARFELRLLNKSAPGQGRSRTAKDWCAQSGCVAATNPSMFHGDGRSVSYMRSATHVNNGKRSKDKTVLVFGPKKPGLAPVRLLDRDCDEVDELLPQYESAVQSIRMVSCRRKNVWAAAEKRWSAAATGVDAQGRLLFVHVRSPYTMHELVDALLALPLGLSRLLYGEGGPEAQLWVGAGGREISLVGSYETGFHEADDVLGATPIPNVLAVFRRKP